MTSLPRESPPACSSRKRDRPAILTHDPEPAPAEGALCPSCGHSNRPQSQFCGSCGAPLARYCPHCGQLVAAAVVCCDRCAVDHPPATLGRCQTCGSSNELDAERCQQCGARLLINCAHCDALIPASFSHCPQCGFDCSRQVVDRVVERFETPQEEAGRPWPSLDASTALMSALIILSLALMVYILWQIWAR